MPVVVSSDALRGVFEQVRRVAITNATVLITGESGSGKELIARAIHHHSLRCSKPWVDVSCAALPEHLVESELFGYEKGAFSGADSLKPGLFEMAHTGTLLLDEIGELEPRIQVKLLRVLDGTPYYRLGGVRKISVDVRIIAATNQELEEAVRSGRFRSDLFHRLGQIVIRVPSLRERREDIVPIASFFLAQHSRELRLSAGARRALEAYSWPGNVRELRNVVTKTAVFAAGAEIRAQDLPPEIRTSPDTPAALRAPSSLDGMERRTILQTLAETGGHHQKAAEMLGISRRTLTRKLKQYKAETAAEPAAVR